MLQYSDTFQKRGDILIRARQVCGFFSSQRHALTADAERIFESVIQPADAYMNPYMLRISEAQDNVDRCADLVKFEGIISY